MSCATGGSRARRLWKLSCTRGWRPACATGHAYRAVGDVLPDYSDGHGNPPSPPGWATDPEAFRSGLDMSTLDLTSTDRANLNAWYERTIGYVPRSVEFGMRWDPRVFKVHRSMWEVAIKTLPKQVVPYMMLRDATLENNVEALREAALLGKAWGLTPDWIVRGITQTMHYFTGLRGLYTASDAVDDLLRDWTTPGRASVLGEDVTGRT